MTQPKPTRLQGTDGIRAHVEAQLPEGHNPVDYFLSSQRLTPAFFELYAYCFATLLKQEGLAKDGDWLSLGWDTRDPAGIYNQAAVQGVRKAKLNARILGVQPTPAIALYQLTKGDKGALALTASHNPADQNGIKLFLGETGLKFLPADDQKLTRLLYQMANLDLANLPASGESLEEMEEARLFFRQCMLEGENSWLNGESFADHILVVDASRGAVAPIVGPIFNRIGAAEVHYCCMEGAINEHSGVAEIEGRSWISEAMLQQSYQGFEALELLFELAHTPEVRGGHKKLVGLVFDGDGDRFFRLDYCPKKMSLRVSSGDRVGIHQADHLQRHGQTGGFLHTVESDLMIAAKAKELGFSPQMTGVGDKWILTQAYLSQLAAEVTPAGQTAGRFVEYLGSPDLCQTSAIQLSTLVAEARGKGWLNPAAQGNFRLGLEESGHAITPTWVPTPQGTRIAFAGNGIKAALNDLAAVAAHPSLIDTPYSEGIKRTAYAYYVNKALLEPGQALRRTLEQSLLEWCQPLAALQIQARLIPFVEESSMLFCSLERNGVQVGALYARNSGTEDKTSIYLRGEKSLEEALVGLMDRLHVLILVKMKNPSHPKTLRQRELLLSLSRFGRLDCPPEDQALMELMERKEELVSRDSGSWRLSVKGMAFSDLYL